MIKHFTLLCAVMLSMCALMLTSCSDDDDDDVPPVQQTAPNGASIGDASDYGDPRSGEKVGTGNFTDLTLWSVRLLCSVDVDGLGDNMPKTTFGVVYSTKREDLMAKGSYVQTIGTTANRYEVIVSGLRPDTEYFYCAYGKIDNASSFFSSEVRSFRTGRLSLSTGGTSAVSEFAATAEGKCDISQLPSDTKWERGILLSVDDDPDIDQYLYRVVSDSKDNSFTSTFSNLHAGMKYRYRAYLCVDDKSGRDYFYGDVKEFTTSSLSFSTGDAANIGYNSADITCTVSAELLKKLNVQHLGIFLSTKANPSSSNYDKRYTASASGGKFTVNLTNLALQTTYYYCAYICAYDERYNTVYYYGEAKSFKTKGYTYSCKAVDLGLSVKWADCNLGASKASETGAYFAWGETNTSADYSTWYGTSYSNLYSRGVTDANNNLTSTYDVAKKKLGGKWRMPTCTEFEELRNNCTWKWTTKDGVKGYTVTGKNGNSIFLPAAGYRGGTTLYDGENYGYYWSATAYRDSYWAYSMYFSSGTRNHSNYYNRYYGLPVRAVTE